MTAIKKIRTDPIKIESATEFTRLRNGLAKDVVGAYHHWHMIADLQEAHEKYPLVELQSRTFWYLTREAHKNACLHQLCRVFDQTKKTLNLFSWLSTIKISLSMFDVEEFRLRLKDNPFVESLAASAVKPDQSILDRDLALCHETDPIVRKLYLYRGDYVAHRNAKKSKNTVVDRTATDITDDVIETLLKRAISILNNYSSLFAAEIYSTTMHGQRDFKYIFTSVQDAVISAQTASSKLRGQFC
jgi:AbiU2